MPFAWEWALRLCLLFVQNMPVDSDPEGNYTLENVKKLVSI